MYVRGTFTGDRSVLEKNLKLMMESVDDLVQDTNKFNNYQRQAGKQELNKKQYLQKRVNATFRCNATQQRDIAYCEASFLFQLKLCETLEIIMGQ